MINEKKQEFTLRISQANSTGLITILYEMFLIYINDAKREHANGNRQEFRAYIKKAKGCIGELISSLNYSFEPASCLLELYNYINRELATASIQNDDGPLNNSIIIISALHESYMLLAAKDQSPPLMENTQSVYAGLTYGKGSLTENLQNPTSGRGYSV